MYHNIFFGFQNFESRFLLWPDNIFRIGKLFFLNTRMINILNLFLNFITEKYETFKNSIHELFPLVYDTKHLSFELKNVMNKGKSLT